MKTINDPSPCPSCGKNLAAASPVERDRPKRPRAGDLSICAYCALVLRYVEQGDGLGIHRLTDEDLAALPEQMRQQIADCQEAVRKVAEESQGSPAATEAPAGGDR